MHLHNSRMSFGPIYVNLTSRVYSQAERHQLFVASLRNIRLVPMLGIVLRILSIPKTDIAPRRCCPPQTTRSLRLP